MEHYLIRLSYTAPAWQQQIERTTDADRRLLAVRKLITGLGGSFAHYHFFEGSESASLDVPPYVLDGKFVGIGEDDIITIVALPNIQAASAFSMAVSAEIGVKSVQLTPLLPMTQAVDAMAMARDSRKKVGYSAPGGGERSWEGSPAAGPSVKRGGKTTPTPQRPPRRRGSTPGS